MKIKTKLLTLLALCCILSAPLNILGYSWGIERGRANEGDVARLLVDQLALMRALRRIDEAISRPLAVERQRQLLGLSGGGGLVAELLDEVYEWWRKDVMGPAGAIVGNPAASCSEAQVAIQNLLRMMLQRDLLGMSPVENDKSEAAEKARALDRELMEMFDVLTKKMGIRCREEALDECVMTGRFEQLFQTELGLSRQLALLGDADGPDYKWIDDALQQCAIYELHFVSTTKATQIFNVETVRDGKITLKFEEGASGSLIGGAKLGDLLKGETKGAENPFLVSVKCSQPPLEVVCLPGDASDPVTSHVISLDLKHREFYVDASGISRQRTVGEDKVSFEFARGIYALDGLIKIPGGGSVPLPLQGLGFAFYIAHKKDRFPDGYRDTPAVKIANNKRGVYPVLFNFIYADQNTDGASASDSTVFELIHKPKPKPIQREPEKPKDPLKPSTRIKRIGG